MIKTTIDTVTVNKQMEEDTASVGYPDSDNDDQYQCVEFREYCHGNGCNCLHCHVERQLDPYIKMKIEMNPMDLSNITTFEYWIIH